jgi:hypothetical protein
MAAMAKQILKVPLRAVRRSLFMAGYQLTKIGSSTSLLPEAGILLKARVSSSADFAALASHKLANYPAAASAQIEKEHDVIARRARNLPAEARFPLLGEDLHIPKTSDRVLWYLSRERVGFYLSCIDWAARCGALSPEAVVADVGTAVGALPFLLQRSYPGLDVTGYDFNEEYVQC